MYLLLRTRSDFARDTTYAVLCISVRWRVSVLGAVESDVLCCRRAYVQQCTPPFRLRGLVEPRRSSGNDLTLEVLLTEHEGPNGAYISHRRML